MEPYLPGSLSSEGSLLHLPLSLQPYGVSSGIKIYTTWSEWRVLRYVFGSPKYLMGWGEGENNLSMVVTKSILAGNNLTNREGEATNVSSS